MSEPWDAAIRKTKQLTVSPSKQLVDSPAWGAAIFKRIVDEFNRLSLLHKLGVTLVSSKVTSGNANVEIDVSATLVLPTEIKGLARVASQGGEIQKVIIFLPENPLIEGAGSRGVGTGAKLAIAIHEVIHACGLEETDPGHGPNGNPDVFMSFGQLSARFPPDGNPGDRIDLGGGKFVPPIFITARTARLIQDV